MVGGEFVGKIINTWEQLQRTGSVYWGRGDGFYAPGKRLGVRFLWPAMYRLRQECWKILHLHIQGLWSVYVGGEPYKVKKGVKPDNSQDNKFLLGLMVEQLTLKHQVGRGRNPPPAILI